MNAQAVIDQHVTLPLTKKLEAQMAIYVSHFHSKWASGLTTLTRSASLGLSLGSFILNSI